MVQYKITITQITTKRSKKDKPTELPVEFVMYQQMVEQKQIEKIIGAANDSSPAKVKVPTDTIVRSGEFDLTDPKS